jgi:hypothetical protein
MTGRCTAEALMAHMGHEISVDYYSDGRVTLECDTCNCVIFSKPIPKKTARRYLIDAMAAIGSKSIWKSRRATIHGAGVASPVAVPIIDSIANSISMTDSIDIDSGLNPNRLPCACDDPEELEFLDIDSIPSDQMTGSDDVPWNDDSDDSGGRS